MFGLSFGEIVVLAALGLIFIGPKQMPELAKVLGRTLGELRKAMNDVKSGVTSDFMDSKKSSDVAKKENPIEKRQKSD